MSSGEADLASFDIDVMIGFLETNMIDVGGGRNIAQGTKAQHSTRSGHDQSLSLAVDQSVNKNHVLSSVIENLNRRVDDKLSGVTTFSRGSCNCTVNNDSGTSTNFFPVYNPVIECHQWQIGHAHTCMQGDTLE